MAEVEHVLEIHNVIGEGPVWHSQEGFLYWVNFIGEFQILRFSPHTRRLEVFETGMPVMALGIRKTGGFIAATDRRYRVRVPAASQDSVAAPPNPQPIGSA